MPAACPLPARLPVACPSCPHAGFWKEPTSPPGLACPWSPAGPWRGWVTWLPSPEGHRSSLGSCPGLIGPTSAGRAGGSQSLLARGQPSLTLKQNRQGSWKPGSGAQESDSLQLWGSSVQARALGRGRDRGDLPCQKRPLAYFVDTQMPAPLPQTLRESLGSGQESARVTRPLSDCHVP